MADIIKLLPDHVANQIAAGEVIQRPGSVVKELVENAVDSGANDIKVIIKDSGKTLIQVIDNGVGMSATDVRMCLERHATSKIKDANDLFSIKTFGFRGEAMASIAAVSHLEINTRLHQNELGTRVLVEGSKVITQEPCSTQPGTSTSVKNLFYNIPARRKFLKSDAAEFRNIIDEFQRIAIPNSQITFSLYHNGSELFRLQSGTLRQRIVGIFGKSINDKLVPVNEETSIVKIAGFISKPEAAKKTRGEQFFFVNNRYIKSTYFNHGVISSYQELIPDGFFPSYFLNFEINPQTIDVNIHPTKTEIKFEDEKDIFVILKTTLRKSLGQYNIVPSLDFTSDVQFAPPPKNRDEVNTPGVFVNPNFNPFTENNINQWQHDVPKGKNYNQFSVLSELENVETTLVSKLNLPDLENPANEKTLTQLHHKFILAQINSGLLVIHQQRAHERILFEKYLDILEKGLGATQTQLFPETIEFSTYDAHLITDLLPDLKLLGFDISNLGKNTFAVNGLPSTAINENPSTLLENTLEHYKTNRDKLTLDKRKNLAVSLARNTSVKVGKPLTRDEMTNLIDQLFACEMPYATPAGKPIVNTILIDDLNKRFE